MRVSHPAARPLAPAERAALAAAAAERVMSILAVTASPRTTSVVRGLLSDLWSALASGSNPIVDETIRKIEHLPESRETNPDRRAFVGMEALGVIVSAYTEFQPGHPMAAHFEDAAAEMMGALDGLELQRRGKLPRFVDPRNPPPPGRFEAGERERQAEDLALLRTHGSVTRAVDELRVRSEAHARKLTAEARPLVDLAYPTLRSRVASRLGLSRHVTLRDAD